MCSPDLLVLSLSTAESGFGHGESAHVSGVESHSYSGASVMLSKRRGDGEERRMAPEGCGS